MNCFCNIQYMRTEFEEEYSISNVKWTGNIWAKSDDATALTWHMLTVVSFFLAMCFGGLVNFHPRGGCIVCFAGSTLGYLFGVGGLIRILAYSAI